MLYLGQAVQYRLRQYPAEVWVPGVFLSKDPNTFRLVCLDDENKITEHDAYLMEINFVKEPDKTSPTGQQIYYGEFCVKGLKLSFKRKRPPEEGLLREFKKIKRLIDKEQ